MTVQAKTQLKQTIRIVRLVIHNLKESKSAMISSLSSFQPSFLSLIFQMP